MFIKIFIFSAAFLAALGLSLSAVFLFELTRELGFNRELWEAEIFAGVRLLTGLIGTIFQTCAIPATATLIFTAYRLSPTVYWKLGGAFLLSAVFMSWILFSR